MLLLFKVGELLLLTFAGFAAQEPASPSIDQVRLILRARLAPTGAAPRLEVEGQRFQASSFLACFYERRGYLPAWSVDGTPRPEAGELLVALAAAADDGLRAEDYRTAALTRLAAAARGRPEAGAVADLDLLLTDAFLTYAAHIRRGRVNPQAIYRDCALKPDASDLATILEEALAGGAGGAGGKMRATLAGLAPPHRGYALLREALGRYRRLAAAGSRPVPPGPTLRAGERGERVAALRARLAEAAIADAAGTLPAGESADLFDPPLEEAVRGFQRRHGLEDDGVVGPATLAELNQRPEDHIRQIEVNLERWRWLPRDLGRRHVRVNIAGFHLEAVDEGRAALEMRIIVGKPYTRTPTFSSAIETVVLNPSWYVPRSIAVNEIFPRARKDPGYLQRGGYEVLPGSRLRQRPGPQNALGRIKFLFPNRFGVYLHDTPSRSLFAQTVRTFSHGCMRIEKPFDLAVWALRDEPRWTPEAIRAGIDAGRERSVKLTRTLPVHVGYWTAWGDGAGVLQLGRDVYGRDAELARLLAGGSPVG